MTARAAATGPVAGVIVQLGGQTPLGLPLVDLQPILAAQPDRGGLFFQRTVHLTPRGHRVVAGALAEFLESSGLVADR